MYAGRLALLNRAITVGVIVVLLPAAICVNAWGGTSKLHNLLPAAFRDKSFIDVAAVSDYPPLSYSQGGTSTIVGFDIDLLNATAKALGTKFVYVNTPYSNEIPELESGRAVIAEGGDYDVASQEAVTTLIDYLNTGYQLLVQESNPEHITGLSTICGDAVAIIPNEQLFSQIVAGASKKCVAAGKKPATTAIYPTQDAAELALKSGRSQAVMEGQLENSYAVKQGEPFKPEGQVLDSQPIGIQVPKSMSQLAKALQAGMQAVVNNGEFAKLLKKWDFPESTAMKTIEINVASNTK